MKTIYLEWSDAEGVSFILRTSGLWPFEFQEINAAFVAAGYVGHGASHFVSTTQPNPGGPHAITDALEAIGYKVEHQREAAEAVARERRRQVFEAIDKIEPFAAIQPTRNPRQVDRGGDQRRGKPLRQSKPCWTNSMGVSPIEHRGNVMEPTRKPAGQ
ncbi:hypothetical protein [Rhizobium ruizarguesonis]|uniref:hypothetical protein n=1 Tax=Rhizobium ruizarguesonis TaxID=2081791 RepID=UPI0010385F9F|nr:hypothetical protein [Rhizobium ruizarguesonis]TBB32439.1 hypothetical protein ELH47_11095 [Rhizobium ruizarguesonis]